jgi:hypothetical protein
MADEAQQLSVRGGGCSESWGISLLHGQSASTAARPTSVSPNPQAAARAEVDYIAAAASLPATEYRELPTPRHGASVGNMGSRRRTCR